METRLQSEYQASALQDGNSAGFKMQRNHSRKQHAHIWKCGIDSQNNNLIFVTFLFKLARIHHKSKISASILAISRTLVIMFHLHDSEPSELNTALREWRHNTLLLATLKKKKITCTVDLQFGDWWLKTPQFKMSQNYGWFTLWRLTTTIAVVQHR